MLGLFVALHMHENVDEIVAANREHRHLRVAYNGGVSSRAVHNRQLAERAALTQIGHCFVGHLATVQVVFGF